MLMTLTDMIALHNEAQKGNINRMLDLIRHAEGGLDNGTIQSYDTGDKRSGFKAGDEEIRAFAQR